MSLGKLLQTADWKNEKHVPNITAPDKVKAGEAFKVKVQVGEEIAHPNQFEHSINWIKLFFHPQGSNFAVEIASFSFAAHGEGGCFTEPMGSTMMSVDKPGTLHAVSYCNIHGLWEQTKDLKV